MSRSRNAQLAVEMYDELRQQHHWTKADAWHGIAILLLTCEVWRNGWESFHDVIVYREVNDFKIGPKGPNTVLTRAENLTDYLAQELGIPRPDLCNMTGLYWRHPDIAPHQPHNLLGHAFRSIVVSVLERFGDQGINYEEEVSPYSEFPGQQFFTRSKKPRIDIVARRGNTTVALISTRWRFRHDRVDVVEEALAYVPAARRHNPKCQLYAAVGEFAPNRLIKILDTCPPVQPHGALSSAVHFAPALIKEGLNENGRMLHLKSLEWLIDQTFTW